MKLATASPPPSSIAAGAASSPDCMTVNHATRSAAGYDYNMELRWDGVPSLADAMRMLREQAKRTPPPQWVRVVGGFTRTSSLKSACRR